ncbi:hypothetical protein EUX98_g9518 [Antrodiella citrinella]|uniref:Uncharacterized protein n=1 Tax=Antrodiella citrinella TaxID=2447956 RepID=A0A4S4LTQ6_9APHY|nr:hypothetical protein EUX98_g9518 [Antrodiella citrinella]
MEADDLLSAEDEEEEEEGSAGAGDDEDEGEEQDHPNDAIDIDQRPHADSWNDYSQSLEEDLDQPLIPDIDYPIAAEEEDKIDKLLQKNFEASFGARAPLTKLFFDNITLNEINNTLDLVIDSALVEGHILDSNMASQMGIYWEHRSVVQKMSTAHDIWANVLHQRIILVDVTVFDFLRGCHLYISEIVSKHVDCSRQCACSEMLTGYNKYPWLTNLVLSIMGKYEDRKSNWTVSSANFLPTLEPAVEYVFSSTKTKRFYRDNKYYQPEVVGIVLQALTFWLHLPSRDQIIKMQGFSLLRKAFGNSILLIPTIWKCWNGRDCRWFADDEYKGRRNQGFSDGLNDFKHHLKNKMLELEANQGREVLVALQSAYSDFVAKAIAPSSSRIHVDHPSLPPLQNIPPSNTVISSLSSNFMCEFVDFLRHTLAVHKSNNDACPPKLLALIQKDGDKYSLIRESAPCRAKARLDGGYATPELACTPSGVFSALVFRNITYGSLALATAPPHLSTTYFPSIEAWNDHVAAIHAHWPGKDEKFFCNRNAYGQTVKRYLANASVLWTASNTATFAWVLDLPNYNACDPNRSFQFAFSQAKKIKIPAFGKLQQHLWKADLVCIGIVDPPSWKEICAVAKWLDAGALKGFGMLRAAQV